jgi:hypothetical protein
MLLHVPAESRERYNRKYHKVQDNNGSEVIGFRLLEVEVEGRQIQNQ